MGEKNCDVVIVGAGFAGLYLLHKMRGLGLSARVIEAGGDVGGTWYWNRYPGARCDVESMEYSYSWSKELEQEWTWSERYSTQPEILRYINHVADRFDLRGDIQFETRVLAATYDEENNLWTVDLDSGESVTARHVVMATGCLSSPNLPQIPGMEDFEGPTYQTGLWPHEGVDFTGQKVGVIGTGSSAIQSIPIIADQAAELTVMQRTPNFVVPAHNRPLSAEEIAETKAGYPALREQAREEAAGFTGSTVVIEEMALDTPEADRNAEFERRWAQGGLCFMASYPDVGTVMEANDLAAEFIRTKIRERVNDPEAAELLCPTGYPAGAKRLCVDTNYFETYNRDHVHLVDLKTTPIERITAKGVQTSDREFEFDAIVYATGFDAMTGTLDKIAITGRGGRTLKDKWRDGPETYLGLMSEGFPNLFLVTGPQSPSVLSNMIVSIEQHVDWITDTIRDIGDGWIEPTRDAEKSWVEHTNFMANLTVYPYANSWYMGANIPGKPRIFMAYLGGVPGYRAMCNDSRAKGYAGFTVSGETSGESVDYLSHLDLPEEILALVAA